MTWIQVDIAVFRHPKRYHLAELLFNGTIPDDAASYATLGLLNVLWCWALDYAPDGDLGKFSPLQIARGCEWHGDPQALVDALRKSGWLDKWQLHDWEEYAGKLVRRREHNRQQMAAARAREQHVSNTCRPRVEKRRVDKKDLVVTDDFTQPEKPITADEIAALKAKSFKAMP